ncbi:MAG: dephospho-CoA kinase [Alistipes sp.]|nr:dephospho-CoA kinase [Alistipes sp.]MBO7306720.1 dephospho-CoA kinase [Alistipes sp.]
MYKVGITGGIGSGKSVVSAMLQERGVAVYFSDIRAKELMATDDGVRQQLVERFGADVFEGGVLNRAYLAERVFASTEELSALNAIVHPAVLADFERWAEAQSGDYVVLESAILFESGFDAKVDIAVAVMAPEELRVERVMSRDGVSREQVEERMRHQLSDEERCSRSKYAIVNIELDELEEDVEQLHRRLSYDARQQHS